jgi:hypothetical protein
MADAMNLVERQIIRARISMSVDGGTEKDSLIVFRRNDTRKRINICGRRYGFDEKTRGQLMLMLRLDALDVTKGRAVLWCRSLRYQRSSQPTFPR